jgi:hypothetical protein
MIGAMTVLRVLKDSGKDDYNTMEFEISREFNSHGKVE